MAQKAKWDKYHFLNPGIPLSPGIPANPGIRGLAGAFYTVSSFFVSFIGFNATCFVCISKSVGITSDIYSPRNNIRPSIRFWLLSN